MEAVFNGIFTDMLTALDEEENFDQLAMKKQIDWQIANHVAGIVILSSVGEGDSFTKEERQNIAETCLQYIDGRVPCVVGVTAESTREIIDCITSLQTMGAGGILLNHSYHYKPTLSELKQLMTAVAQVATIPLISANNPLANGIDFTGDFFYELSQLPHCAYVKEASMEIRRVREILDISQCRINVLTGTDNIAFESFILGASGWISAAANVYPAECSEIYDLMQKNKINQAQALYYHLLPFFNYLGKTTKTTQALKTALKQRCDYNNYCRHPRLSLNEAELKKLEKALKVAD